MERVIRHMQLEERDLYVFLPYLIDKDLVDLMINAHRNLIATIAEIKAPHSKNDPVQYSVHWLLKINDLLSLKKEHIRKEGAVVFWLVEVKMQRYASPHSSNT